MASNSPKSTAGRVWESVINAITGNFPKKEFEDKAMVARDDQYTSEIRNELLNIAQSMQIKKPDNNLSLPFIQSIAEKNVVNSLENERLIQMCPEISLSALIMISSILSPNDMRVGLIRINSNCPSLPPDKNQAIEKYISQFFEDKLNLSTSLPRWIYTAMYRSGATALLTIPVQTLMNELNDKKNYITSMSTESLNEMEKTWEKTSVHGFDNSSISTESYLISVEDTFNTLCAEEYHLPPIELHKEKLKPIIAEMCSTEDLTILDNFNVLTAKRVKTETTRIKNKNKQRIYLPQQFLGLPDTEQDELDAVFGNPIFMELPYESVIPIFTPGTPSDHIGYFVILDEKGHPIIDPPTSVNTGTLMNGMQSYENTERAGKIAGLFQAQGYANNALFDKIPVRKMMEDIYQSVIEYHLTAKSMQAGYADVSIGSNPALYRAMFTRYLAARKTKVLFVEKKYLTYLCYEHGKDGCGVSKLENIKHITSLHVSLRTSLMIASANNSINRQRIILTAGDTQIGNIVQLARDAQQNAIAKNIWDFQANPAYMCNRIAEQSVSVELRGVAGLGEFSLEKETDTRAPSVLPDTELAEEIKNSLIMGLEVPAAALNNVGENEYSRSVATQNLIFSRRVSTYQKPTIKYMSDFIRTYCRFSGEVISNITAIVTSSKVQKDGNTHRDPQLGDHPDQVELVNEVINNLTVYLPDPTLAPDNTQLENATSTLQAITSLIEATHDDASIGASDPTTAVGVNVSKGVRKRLVVKELISKLGFSEEVIETLCKNLTPGEILTETQYFATIVAALKQQSGIYRQALSDQQYDPPPGTDPGANIPDPNAPADPNASGDPNAAPDPSQGGNPPPDPNSPPAGGPQPPAPGPQQPPPQ